MQSRRLTPLRAALVLVVAVVAQIAIVADLRIIGAVGDLMLVVTVAAALTGGPDRGAAYGFFAGLTFDLVLDEFSHSHRTIAGLTTIASQDSVDTDADASFMSDAAGQAETSLSADVMAARPQRKGFAGLLLELWLWLQFSVVVMVFLWAMARRGPANMAIRPSRRSGLGCPLTRPTRSCRRRRRGSCRSSRRRPPTTA